MAQTQNTTSPDETEDDITLFKLAAAGDPDAREQIIINYLPLVHKHAVAFSGRGVPFEDLYQEGCYGLLLAIDHYDYQRNTHFSTFSSHYIKKFMRKSTIEQNNLFPGTYKEDLYFEIKAYIKAFKEFYENNQREATLEEVAAITNISIWRLKRLKLIVNSFQAQSLDIDVCSSIDCNQPFSRPVEDEVFRSMGLDVLNVIFTKREEEVLRRRLGFTATGEAEKWQEISAAMHLSIATLRKSYNSGLEKIRSVYDE